jgi:hypothetical protein
LEASRVEPLSTSYFTCRGSRCTRMVYSVPVLIVAEVLSRVCCPVPERPSPKWRSSMLFRDPLVMVTR